MVFSSATKRVAPPTNQLDNCALNPNSTVSSAKRVSFANRQLHFSSPLLFSSIALRFALQNKVKLIKLPLLSPLCLSCLPHSLLVVA
jgi:hypothetical protein